MRRPAGISRRRPTTILSECPDMPEHQNEFIDSTAEGEVPASFYLGF
jgi:hypothetical protein